MSLSLINQELWLLQLFTCIYILLIFILDVDYSVSPNPVITFGEISTPGSTSCVTVTVIDDTIVENEESFAASLKPDNDQPVITSSPDSLTVNILEDENDG